MRIFICMWGYIQTIPDIFEPRHYCITSAPVDNITAGDENIEISMLILINCFCFQIDKLESWAAEMKQQFEDIENFELSIEEEY